MRYIKTHWIHKFPDEPEWLLSEIDDDRWEVRKVEIYRDGRFGFASPGESSGSTWLSDRPIPPLDEIDSPGEFESSEISADEFERAWERRLQSANH